MNKPNWEDAPGWAFFLTQDRDGWWCWWNLKPVANESDECWDSPRGVEGYEYVEPFCGEPPTRDWKVLLEPRP